MKNAKTVLCMLFVMFFIFSVNAESVKNVIFLIGDGMGIPQITLSRVVNEGHLVMDTLKYSGLISTHSASNNITDSAAAGTALSTGYKTTNGMIAVTPDGKSVKTILELAKESGRKTGIVTTTTVTHATPACFTAHNAARGNEYEIAENQLLTGADVMLGGGFKRYAKILDKVSAKNYQLVKTRDELTNIKSGKVLGLFTESYMNYELDRTVDEPSIALMTRKALELLKNDNGFFLMVEGGRIDHAAHANDPVGTVYDTLAFDKAVNEALSFAKLNRDTLIVVTADHSTGGLALGKKKYEYFPEVLKGFQHTPDFIISLMKPDFSDAREIMEKYTGYKWDDKDVKTVMAEKDCKRPSYYSLGGQATYVFTKIINNKAMIDWTTSDHEGSMVAVMADGINANLFTGMLDNTDIPVKIAEAMGLKL
ncbi:MAG: alkaline phosphatase, partial [Candidatus Muirbacterium halophilum]|nr:alkaline phosphatase [Candidatus Muirbacterium halophilum]